ncbi:hypothetical protein DFR29_115108 [Tahibacter aquaticus]|uniref:DUF3352 domain-containing protein n=1 Tax=Tahibacter aquaticus TaxID=520092 RepID=A0A4R6YPJ1_9GAMM|nr:hypothetical protein [Tahibacter aquaticus]TDR39718.1 hypothetical protein DFR29_115108 [Tahibacter aquaticus]
MPALARRLTPLALLLALAGCGSKPAADSPLAYVPADTPYVIANLEPTPQAVLDQWTAMTKEMLPISLGMYQRALDKIGSADSTGVKAARALLDELAQHMAQGSLAPLGLSGSAHVAIYGIGLLPVMRLELADPAALRAAIARVEAKAGAPLPLAKLGELEYWSLQADKAVVLMAISGKHLVLSIAPAKASDELRKQLLGVTPPKNSLDPAKLEELNKKYGYTKNGSGYVDFVRLTEFLSNDSDPLRIELATALGEAAPRPLDPTCKAELGAMAAKLPRLAMGYTELAAKRMTLHAQLEMEAVLAKDFTTAWAGAPGTAGAAEGLFDLAVSLPLLKQKSFWLKQANAVAAKPWACTQLAELNQTFAQFKQSLDTTIPPPASDLTGLRLVISRFSMDAAKPVPEFSGKLLLGLTNPGGALAMGQLTLPSLKDLKLLPDGKPVALPADTIPMVEAPHAAMNDKALALSVGAGEEASLAAFLAAAPVGEAKFLRVHFTGDMYGQFGSLFDKFSAFMPEDQRGDIESQKQLFAIYQKTIKFVDISLVANAGGVAFYETGELK